MCKFGLIKSFGIDNDELAGLRRKDCFVLGYELATIDHELTTGARMERPVHAENRERVEASCRDAGRDFSLTWSSVDPSESWLHLVVEPRADKREADARATT